MAFRLAGYFPKKIERATAAMGLPGALEISNGSVIDIYRARIRNPLRGSLVLNYTGGGRMIS